MKLSELVFGKIEKDGEFDWLGLTAEEYTGKKVLTFLNDEKYYKAGCLYGASLQEVITHHATVFMPLMAQPLSFSLSDLGVLPWKMPNIFWMRSNYGCFRAFW